MVTRAKSEKEHEVWVRRIVREEIAKYMKNMGGHFMFPPTDIDIPKKKGQSPSSRK